MRVEGKVKVTKKKTISLWKIISRTLWTVIIIIILSSIGTYFISRGTKTYNQVPSLSKSVTSSVPWSQIDEDVKISLQDSHNATQKFVSDKLDTWVSSCMQKVDPGFLDWYFGYFNQQLIGLNGFWNQAKHLIDPSQPTAKEKAIQDFQEEFANRVLVPPTSQLVMEQLTEDAVNFYVSNLQENLGKIQTRYNIPRQDWDRHLNDLGTITYNVEGNREVPISFKEIAGGSAKAIVVTGKLVSAVKSGLASKVSIGVTEGATAIGAEGIVTVTGKSVAAEFGGKFLGPIIQIGIVGWDLWDHYETTKVERPVLKQNINDYFNTLEETLSNDPDTGIMTPVNKLQSDLLESMTKANQ